uniref:Uncharacterized protein n=1 Tax=Arion vulgaris TaxID=1028688 RepID=A0A0B7AXC8_9EUPU
MITETMLLWLVHLLLCVVWSKDQIPQWECNSVRPYGSHVDQPSLSWVPEIH